MPRLLAALTVWTLCGCQTSAPSLQIGLNFTASTLGIHTQSTLPADTMGGVGPHHIVEIINSRYAVYRKVDGTLIESRTLEQFWRDAGAGPINVTLDSRLIYDPFSQRWFIASAHVAFPNNQGALLLAVSRSADPTEGWTGFSMLSAPGVGRRLGDFPRLGIDAGAVYVKTGVIDAEECVQVIAIVPKADLLARTPTVANASLVGDMECNGGLSAAVDLDDTGSPYYFVQSEVGAGKVALLSLSGSIRAPAIDRRDIPARAYSFAPPATQPAAPTQKPGIRVFPSITAAPIFRDGVIWSVETIGHEERAAVRWFKIDAKKAALLQEGIISDPVLHFFNASIAVNASGSVVIGFNGSSASQFVSVYAVAGATDALGTTVFGQPALVKEGTDDFGLGHWGDYSATVIDPVDPTRFWTFQEWVSADDVYSTQITELIVERRSRLSRLLARWWQ